MNKETLTGLLAMLNATGVAVVAVLVSSATDSYMWGIAAGLSLAIVISNQRG